MLIDYYSLSWDSSAWSTDEKKLYDNSCKNYNELKIKLSKEFPDLYMDVTGKIDLIKTLDKDSDLAVIIAIKNKLSYEYKRLHITILMQGGEILRPTVIGYYYNGIIEV